MYKNKEAKEEILDRILKNWASGEELPEGNHRT